MRVVWTDQCFDLMCLDRHFVCSSLALGSTKVIVPSHFLHVSPCSTSNSSYLTFLFCNLEISNPSRRPFSFFLFSNIPRSFLSFPYLYYMRISSRTGWAESLSAVRSGYSLFSLFPHCLETAMERALRWKGTLQRHCWHIAGLYETWCLEGWTGRVARYWVYSIVFVILDGATARALDRW